MGERILDDEGLRVLVRDAIEHAGSLRAYCQRTGVNPSNLCAWLKRRRGIHCPRVVVESLGYEQIPVGPIYRKRAAGGA